MLGSLYIHHTSYNNHSRISKEGVEMYRSQVFFQTRFNPGAIRDGLITTAKSARYERMLATVAYATERGCKLMNQSLDSEQWRKMKKDWLISFDLGITEPNALRYLEKLPNSEVRIPNIPSVLNSSLRPSHHFHNKAFLFENKRGIGSVALFSGSANLTYGGLLLNDEQGVSMTYILPSVEQEIMMYRELLERKKILEQQFHEGIVLSEDVINRYIELWTRKRDVIQDILEDEVDIVKNVDVPNPATNQKELIMIGLAKCFWIDVKYVVSNLGKGRPGNQIDLSRGSRIFFGFSGEKVPENTVFGNVELIYQGVMSDCSMRFGDNSMDKLTLPLPGNPGPQTYRNQTLLFSKRSDGAFDLYVGNDNDITHWKERSRNQGTTFKMKSGRQYGVFS
jgi:HKD family nuclease